MRMHARSTQFYILKYLKNYATRLFAIQNKVIISSIFRTKILHKLLLSNRARNQQNVISINDTHINILSNRQPNLLFSITAVKSCKQMNTFKSQLLYTPPCLTALKI